MLPLTRRLLAIPSSEVTCARRGFEPCAPLVRDRIEAYFASFLDGYHLALASRGLEQLGTALDGQIEPELRGFAYEGAGMYLTLLDCLTPWRADRLRRFVAGPAQRYSMITLIGAGLAFARVPWVRSSGRVARQHLDPDLRWLAMDGFGFHEGFFHHQRTIEDRRRPARVTGYAARCFDHGLGRSIWFVKGAAPERIAQAVEGFEVGRRADLWAGIGLACAYAGGVHADLRVYAQVLDALAYLAGDGLTELRLGMVLAAFARLESGTPSAWTSLACERVLGKSAEAAGELGRHALEHARAGLAGCTDWRARAGGYELGRQWISRAVRDSAATRAAAKV